jgi:hypothetical protein
MDLKKSNQRRGKLERVVHIAAGLIILFHAYEKHEEGFSSYIYFAIAGILFLSIALFHHSLKSKFPRIDNCFFIIEAISSFIIACDYFHMHKSGLPIVYLIAGIGQLSAIYFFSRKLKK